MHFFDCLGAFEKKLGAFLIFMVHFLIKPGASTEIVVHFRKTVVHFGFLAPWDDVIVTSRFPIRAQLIQVHDAHRLKARNGRLGTSRVCVKIEIIVISSFRCYQRIKTGGDQFLHQLINMVILSCLLKSVGSSDGMPESAFNAAGDSPIASDDPENSCPLASTRVYSVMKSRL